jgi:hypothetical protein
MSSSRTKLVADVVVVASNNTVTTTRKFSLWAAGSKQRASSNKKAGEKIIRCTRQRGVCAECVRFYSTTICVHTCSHSSSSAVSPGLGGSLITFIDPPRLEDDKVSKLALTVGAINQDYYKVGGPDSELAVDLRGRRLPAVQEVPVPRVLPCHEPQWTGYRRAGPQPTDGS